ncbi:hypothetical protein, partial [Akkermansia sp.]|uniref:hypothetical protein n=1 Tax=Akkermansia sp. TaxID=1872421 RepID=UPI003AF7E057
MIRIARRILPVRARQVKKGESQRLAGRLAGRLACSDMRPAFVLSLFHACPERFLGHEEKKRRREFILPPLPALPA